jgi:hypothetical protein
VSGTPTFEELRRLEPRLAELEAEARAVRDTGEREFFCSNFVWLPMYTRLRDVLGAYRQPVSGEEHADVLTDGWAFETAYLHLSRLLPPCRDCGCRLFEPIREAQLG